MRQPRPEDLPQPEEEEREEPPETPDHTMADDEVESTEFRYLTRHPNDWVISGPLGAHGKGPGRRFMGWRTAEAHVRDLGHTILKRIQEAANFGGNRWAFLVKGKR